MRQREEGACYAYSKNSENAFSLPRSEYDRLKREWMAGRAFFEGTGFYGSPIVMKLGDIIFIADTSPEAMALAKADKAEDEREDAIPS